MSCSVIDINKRKCAEQAAEENYTRYQQVTEGSPTGIIITQDQKIVYTNPAFQIFSGYDADELAGKDLLVLFIMMIKSDFLNIPADSGNLKAQSSKMEYRFINKKTVRSSGQVAFFSPIQQKGGDCSVDQPR